MKILDQSFVFIQAEFTFEQVFHLVEKSFDLSTGTYRIRKPITPTEYLPLYALACEKNLQNGLRGVSVNFDDYDLRELPDNLLAVCSPCSFHNTTVSQQQWDNLLASKSDMQSLNLTGISLENIDVTDLFQLHKKNIVFDQRLLFSHPGAICLEKTSIHRAIIDIKVLATFSMIPMYYHFFETAALQIKLRCLDMDAFQYNYFTVARDTYFPQQDQSASPLSARKYTSRFFALTQWTDQLAQQLKKYNPLGEPLDFSQLSTGEKFLWLIYCAHHCPDSLIAASFWRSLGRLPEPTHEKALMI